MKIYHKLKENIKISEKKLKFISELLKNIIIHKTVNMSVVTNTMCNEIKPSSNYRQLQRLLKEETLDNREFIRFIGSFVAKPWEIAIDRTQWSYGKKTFNLLVLSVIYQNQSISLLSIDLDKKGNSSTNERIEIMDRFMEIFPDAVIKCLYADREFIGNKWLKYLNDNGIKFMIRVKDNHLVQSQRGYLSPIKNYFRKHNQDKGYYKEIMGLDLYIIGKLRDDKEYVIVVSNIKGAKLSDYKKRWSIETMFGNLKSRGFNLEDTRIADPVKIIRLFTILSLCVLFCVHFGILLLKKEQYTLTFRIKYKSIFRSGLDFLQFYLIKKQLSLQYILSNTTFTSFHSKDFNRFVVQ